MILSFLEFLNERKKDPYYQDVEHEGKIIGKISGDPEGGYCRSHRKKITPGSKTKFRVHKLHQSRDEAKAWLISKSAESHPWKSGER